MQFEKNCYSICNSRESAVVVVWAHELKRSVTSTSNIYHFYFPSYPNPPVLRFFTWRNRICHILSKPAEVRKHTFLRHYFEVPLGNSIFFTDRWLRTTGAICYQMHLSSAFQLAGVISTSDSFCSSVLQTAESNRRSIDNRACCLHP